MIHTNSTATYITGIKTVQDRLGYCRAVDLAREINITPGSCSTGLKLLEKKGWITLDENKFILLTKQAKKDLKQFETNKEKLMFHFVTMLNITSLNQAEALAMEEVEKIYFLLSDDFINSIK